MTHLTFRRLWVGFFLSCVPALAVSDTLAGRVTRVLDGDTVDVWTDTGVKERVRLREIDAPEKTQEAGGASAGSLSGLVLNQPVTVEYVQRDRYHRILGTVYFAGQDINRTQVERGMAWVYRQYSQNADYLVLESQAKAQHRGLWVGTPTPPWEFRHGR